MSNQKELWENYHANGKHDTYRNQPSEFAKKVLGEIGVGSRLLELGCGNGADAQYFAQQGITVTATDFSEEVLRKNKELIQGVEFTQVDMSELLPFDQESFDTVYANLSLHYFDDETTRRVIDDIRRVTVPGGKLIFRVKSLQSTKEKEGAEEIAPSIFVKDGHLRHLFSTEYVGDTLKGKFRILRNNESSGAAYGYDAYFVECIAQRER